MTFPCVDCGEDTFNEHFMVHDYLWDIAFMGEPGEGDICVGCLERRIGRRLYGEDFTDAPVNDIDSTWTRTSRLIDRLTSTPPV